ncbi:MAG TPA: hypothetical protein VF516_00250 [Kofleriaceae bacterium]
MKINFKFQPVAWMSTVLGALTALMTLDETLEQTHAGDIVPTAWEPYVLGAIAVLTAVLGKVVHSKVTPLADPRAANGRPLVPVPPARVPSGASPDALDAERDH